MDMRKFEQGRSMCRPGRARGANIKFRRPAWTCGGHAPPDARTSRHDMQLRITFTLNAGPRAGKSHATAPSLVPPDGAALHAEAVKKLRLKKRESAAARLLVWSREAGRGGTPVPREGCVDGLVRNAIACGADADSSWPLPHTRETRATSAYPLLAYAVLSRSAAAVQLLLDASARVDARVVDTRVASARRSMTGNKVSPLSDTTGSVKKIADAGLTAVGANALLFALHHDSLQALLPLTFLGGLWACLYAATEGNLLVTVLVHAMWNWRVFLGRGVLS